MYKIVMILTLLSLFLGCGGGGSGEGTTTITDDKIELGLAKEPISYATKEIVLPECNGADPRVQFIRSKADWQNIYTTSKRIFCVKPGNYRDGGAVLIKNKNGTEQTPLYIILDNGNDEHPANLVSSQLASVDFQFENSNYWVIDRMASIGSSSKEDNPILFINSSHNVVNRHFVDKSSGGITIRDGSNDTTIQNSRFQNMSDLGLKNDRTCIVFEPRNSVGKITDTKIIHNEIANCSDGIHLLWRDSISSINYDGTIIYDNDISVDSSLYTDCNGNRTPEGVCSFSENAIDIKAGSSDKNNPIVVKKNRMWGFRKSDTTGTSLADPGAALVLHYGVKHVIMSDNTIFDAVQGILSTEKRKINYALANVRVSNNAILDVEFPLVLNEAYGLEVSKNYVVNSLKSWLILNHSDTVVINDNEIVNKKSVTAIEDKYASNVTDKKNNQYYTIEVNRLRDLSFTTDKFSNAKRTVNPVK